MQYPDFLINRNEESSKTDYGHALLVAGSYGKMGCAVLAAKACMRTGAGLITVHLPRLGVNIMQTAFPEAMISIDADEEIFSSAPLHLERYNAVAIGPGIGTSPRSAEAFAELLHGLPPRTPLVVDADGLNLLARYGEKLLPLLPDQVILTPHEREFDRLAHHEHVSREERLSDLPRIAKELHCTILLKGHRTAICSPEGDITFIISGNAGMATAGSGDVLTGIILGMISQNAMIDNKIQHSMQKIAFFSASIHGNSGEFAVKNQAKCSLIASDLVENIKYVIK